LAGEDQWDDVPTSELDTDYVKSSVNRDSLPELRDFADNRTETLAEHLGSQLSLDRMPYTQRVIYEYLIDSLDPDGFLIDSIAEIYELLRVVTPDVSLKLVQEALVQIQACDPAGVAARELGECLKLQIVRLNLDAETTEIALIITQHLDLLAKNKNKSLRRLCRTSDLKLENAIEIVRKLNPRPAASFAQTENIHIVPDVVVKRHLDQWVLEVNRAIVPKVRVNKHYAKSIRGKGNEDLKQQLQEARWLIQGLVMRGETLIKVSQAIVSRQTGFLEKGETAMQPMMMRELAEMLSVHESTISRVVANKYMQTPRGTYPLRFFFSSQITTDDGQAHSATAIKGLISELIGSENPAKPLSDNKLAQLLKDKGIPVARRTVAKYREALGLASSSERRS
jgi:RNA polymerase sigma-54 factor